MSKRILSDKEVEILKLNKYVKNVSNKGITYTNEFKVLFIAEYELGKTPKEIFKNAGFDVEALGNDRIGTASKIWRASYKKNGELGLVDNRTLNSGRTLKRELTIEEYWHRKI